MPDATGTGGVMTSDPGTYVLVMDEPRRESVAIGKLGTLAFEGGRLLYVGSAFGSGGLRARVRRHLGSTKSLHWHIDYLLESVDVVEVWWSHEPTKREKAWADALREMPEAGVPLRRFGSGDCGCEGHLIRLPTPPDPDALRRRLEESAGPSEPVRRSPPDGIDFD